MHAHSVRLASVCDSVAELVLDFEAEWRQGPPPLDRFRARLTEEGSAYGLAELVKADLQQRYQRGERPAARDYLDRYPELAGEDGHALSLIYEEFCLQAEGEDAVGASEFCDRYPTWRDSLASQLVYHHQLSRAVEPRASGPDFPEEGDRFGDYELVRMLGQGGAARVFLARVSTLGGKEVVLKISRDRGAESAVLGKLDHDNIVAVFAAVVDPITGFRGLCMPYRPGLPLNEVLSRFRRETFPRAASALEAAVPRTLTDLPVEEGRRRGWADFPASGTYPDGVAWIGMKLANALAHAHGNGIFHRDVKPENVLLSRREGPQLLDFNLAHDSNLGDQARAAHRGGTLPYMAREHLQAFLNPSLWKAVGAEADVFSLGLILRELLTLKPVEKPRETHNLARTINDLVAKRSAPSIPIRRLNPRVSHALESIVAKCLAEAPVDRYSNASDLAQDLKRYLDRRPLVVARNPSIVEVASNRLWRRRWLAAVVIAVAGLAGFAFHEGRTPGPSKASEQVTSPIHPSSSQPPAPLVPATPETKRLIEMVRDGSAQNSIDTSTALFRKALERPDAMDAFRIAAEADPGSYRLAMGYGAASSKARRFDVAVNAFQRAVRLDPKAVAARRGLALAQVDLHDTEAALDSINQAFDLFQEDGSIETRREAIRLRIDRSRILLQSGDAAKDRYDFPKARARFHRAILDLAEVRAKIGNHADPTIEFSCDYFLAMIRTSLGDVATSLGETGLAVEAFRTALVHVRAARKNCGEWGTIIQDLEVNILRRLARVE